MKKFMIFQFGLMVGTLICSVVSSVVCAFAFQAFGMQTQDLDFLQDCLQTKLEEKLDVR